MVTAEGVFPKIGNDPLYASEINRFRKGGIFLGGGSTILYGSGTTIKSSVGSILIPAGTLTTPSIISINYRGFADCGVNTYISGHGVNIGYIGSIIIPEPMGKIDILVGSPFLGGGKLEYGQDTSSTINAFYRNCNHVNLGSALVIKFDLIAAYETGSNNLNYAAYAETLGQ